MSLKNRISSELKGDKVIWIIVFLLSIISILAVYSSTLTLAYKERAGNVEFYLLKQFLLIVGGLILIYICHLVHYMRYNQLAPYLMLIAVPLLMYTLFFGTNINQARRWITIPGLPFTFQSSDFAEIALIMYVARQIASKQEIIKNFNSAFVPIIVPIAIICGLIAPANLSTALILFTTCILMMFIGRVETKYIGMLMITGIFVFGLLIIIGHYFPGTVRVDTWVERVRTFLGNGDGGYQVMQAKIAIARGGYFGLGPGNSIQRNFLPSAFSDFIYSIICEEWGLFGALVVLSLYVLLFFRGTKLVTQSQKTFGAMLAMGFCLCIVMQALANMAVSVHLVPATGLTLPFISMGGTSTLFTAIEFGIILSVSKYLEKITS